MSAKKITKVMKYELTYLDGAGSFSEMQGALWSLQKQTREILNKTIRELYFSAVQKTKFEENRFYHQFTDEYPDMAAGMVNAIIQTAKKKHQSSIKEVLKGTISLPSYKQNQPIIFPSQCMKLLSSDDGYTILLSAFSKEYQQNHEGISRPKFKIKDKDRSQKMILERIFSKEYSLRQCQVSYDRPKWFLSLTYQFSPEETKLDESKILGVDLGCVNAVYASSHGIRGVFKIPGDEITAFERKQAAMQNRKPKGTLERIHELEERRWAKQKQARYCGEGRIGHGTKTRVAPAYQDADKIARFRDTINHRYSKALIDYAVKNGFGTIQMEDLSGIKEENGFPKRLQHWTYFDLQTKIQYKAEEHGIIFKKINPQYTSQRCSSCGYIAKENRPSQAEFKCLQCGFQANADYNASQNISIPAIDKEIQKQIKKTDAKKKRS